jgi:hypothetical protein
LGDALRLPRRTVAGMWDLSLCSSFKDSLEHFEQEHGDKLDAADREHLGRWAEWTADGSWAEDWNTIQARARERVELFGTYAASGFFIRYVLRVRRIAQSINQEHAERPRHLKHAEQAENLAKFLKQGNGTLMLPESVDKQLCRLLEFSARRWREPGEFLTFFGPIRVSRLDRKGSRPRMAFMNAMSGYMEDVCGQPLDNVVATLTDIAFQGRPTTIEEVRSARKPTTRSGRSIPRKTGRRQT